MLTGLFGPFIALFLLFVAVLAIFAPIFIWRMDGNIKRIRETIEKYTAERSVAPKTTN